MAGAGAAAAGHAMINFLRRESIIACPDDAAAMSLSLRFKKSPHMTILGHTHQIFVLQNI